MPAVRKATTGKIMYVLLTAAIGTGMLNTVGSRLIDGGRTSSAHHWATSPAPGR